MPIQQQTTTTELHNTDVAKAHHLSVARITFYVIMFYFIQLYGGGINVPYIKHQTVLVIGTLDTSKQGTSYLRNRQNIQICTTQF